MDTATYIGIDVAKAQLVTATDPASQDALVGRLQARSSHRYQNGAYAVWS